MTNPLNLTAGTKTVDQSVVPYIRAKEVNFSAHSLQPTTGCYFFFDETPVDRFVQKSNKLVITTTNAVKFNVGEGLYCNSTHAYGTVLSVTPNSTVYLSENYLCVNVKAYGAGTLTTTSFAKGDIVYQATGTTDASMTFIGTVEYWQPTDKVLVIVPERGTLSTSLETISVLNKTTRCNVESAVVPIVAGNRFPATATISSVSNVGSTAVVSSYVANSSILTKNATSASVIVLPSNTNITNMIGSTFYVTSGLGSGEFALITNASAAANTITLQNNLSKILCGNSRYSIGQAATDYAGYVSGIFNIPEQTSAKFLSGERIFSIQDNLSYGADGVKMSAMARYVSQGFLNMTESFQTPTVQTTAPLRPAPVIVQPQQETRRRDPIAQTFFTPDPKTEKNNLGIFVSSVDLWFLSKPVYDASTNSNAPLPVEVRIVETLNGFPTQKILATAVVPWTQVKTSTVPDGSISSSNATKTKFTFPDPVYLQPSSEYAIVVFSESPNYSVWISELGKPNLAKNNGGNITNQPYSGSFFKSQNASTWTPYQNLDLMFVINKAVFSTTPTTLSFKVNAKKFPILVDELRFHSSQIEFPSTSIKYKVNGKIYGVGTMDGGNFVIPDKPFDYAKDLKVSSKGSNRRRIVDAGNNSSLTVDVIMNTNDSDLSPMFNAERLSAVLFQNIVNSGGFKSSDISITSGGTHSCATNIIVTFSPPDLVATPDPTYPNQIESANFQGEAPTANVLPEQLVAGKVTGINIITPGSGYIRAPTITIEEPAAAANATANVAGEDRSYGGNAQMRYQTRKISLADGFDAGDLRVYVQCVRPKGTYVQAYYKVFGSADSEDWLDRTWVPMALVKDIYSPDQLTLRELEFVPAISVVGEPTGRLEYVLDEVVYPIGGTFKHFAIKLVGYSQDPTVHPVISSMRAIALPGEPNF